MENKEMENKLKEIQELIQTSMNRMMEQPGHLVYDNLTKAQAKLQELIDENN